VISKELFQKEMVATGLLVDSGRRSSRTLHVVRLAADNPTELANANLEARLHTCAGRGARPPAAPSAARTPPSAQPLH
jgi:hypothetical protein